MGIETATADPGFWTGLFSGGGGVLAFVAGIMKFRAGREERFNQRVDKRLTELEVEVEECRRERPYVLLMAAGLKLFIADAQEKDRKNPVLKQVANAFSALPETENKSLADLMEQLNKIPGTRG